ncbi:hypothetical protein RhiirA4_479766 [Rhizophagus irregularis]|uniref:Uncharacterized protein n=1 Tax=Rhizophagus irregularis TaxID=588596 RepID=A0A2I1HGW2_9GLOM|nr:hypothetical protein RhiirA4_479766 [Rhizophagus irregularis]
MSQKSQIFGKNRLGRQILGNKPGFGWLGHRTLENESGFGNVRQLFFVERRALGDKTNLDLECKEYGKGEWYFVIKKRTPDKLYEPDFSGSSWTTNTRNYAETLLNITSVSYAKTIPKLCQKVSPFHKVSAVSAVSASFSSFT